jgi:hypothetical protein
MEGIEGAVLEDTGLETDSLEDLGNEGQEETQTTDPKEGDKEQTPGEKLDGRNRPDSNRKALKWLQDQANEHAPAVKQINNELGRARAYQQVYPTVQEARDSKALFEAVGGSEGVAGLQQARASMERIDSMLEEGNPQVWEDVFKQAPEGMVKLFPSFLDQVAKINPQVFEEVMTPQAVQFMDKQGLTGALNNLIDAFQKDDKESMKTILSRIGGWYGGLKKGATERGAVKPDPEREKFTKEKTEWEEKRGQEESGQAVSSANVYAGNVIDKIIAPDLAKLKLSKEAVGELRQDIWREIQKQRNADQNYKAAIEQKWKGKDRIAESTKYMNSQTDLRAKKIAEKIINTRYGHLLKGGKSATAAPGTKTSPTSLGVKAGVEKVAVKPDRSTIDYDKTTADDILSRRATLTGGKKVSW